MSGNYLEFLKFANKFTEKSGEILRNYYFNDFNIFQKTDGSHVTNVDKEIETMFREDLKKQYPEHGVIGEEFGGTKEKNEFVWVIDPLDGTHSFISGKPLFGTLLCCLQNEEPVIGVIDIPILNQRWHGGKKLGVKLNNNNCSYIENNKNFNQLIISSTSFLMFGEKQQNVIKKIYSSVMFPVFGTDCYGYGLLISGKIDLIIEASMKPWDYIAQVPLINEVGGQITDWKGNKLNLNSDGKVLASTNKEHHKRILELLKDCS